MDCWIQAAEKLFVTNPIASNINIHDTWDMHFTNSFNTKLIVA